MNNNVFCWNNQHFAVDEINIGINGETDLTAHLIRLAEPAPMCRCSVNPVHRKNILIKKVIFKAPRTIVYWIDGDKTIVKADNENFDPEKGLAMAMAKKLYGNKGNYYDEFKRWIKQQNEV